jgi:hypothetical protein
MTTVGKGDRLSKLFDQLRLFLLSLGPDVYHHRQSGFDSFWHGAKLWRVFAYVHGRKNFVAVDVDRDRRSLGDLKLFGVETSSVLPELEAVTPRRKSGSGTGEGEFAGRFSSRRFARGDEVVGRRNASRVGGDPARFDRRLRRALPQLPGKYDSLSGFVEGRHQPLVLWPGCRE